MKKKSILLTTLALGLLTTSLVAQSNVDPSAALEIDSSTKGFLPPRMTTAQRDAIPNPAVGLIIYNTSTQKINYFHGSTNSWEVLESSASGSSEASATLSFTETHDLFINKTIGTVRLTVTNNSLSFIDLVFTAADLTFNVNGVTNVASITAVPSDVLETIAPGVTHTVDYVMDSVPLEGAPGSLQVTYNYASLSASTANKTVNATTLSSNCSSTLVNNSFLAGIDGVYNIQLAGVTHQVYCDMTTSGGGWTRLSLFSRLWDGTTNGSSTDPNGTYGTRVGGPSGQHALNNFTNCTGDSQVALEWHDKNDNALASITIDDLNAGITEGYTNGSFYAHDADVSGFGSMKACYNNTVVITGNYSGSANDNNIWSTAQTIIFGSAPQIPTIGIYGGNTDTNGYGISQPRYWFWR